MKTIRQSIQLLKENIRSILGFELSYRLICMALFLPLLSGLFQYSLHLAGYEYLSGDRLLSYLTRPSTILILLFVIFALSVMTLFEIFCLIPAYHASYHQKKIAVTAMYQHGLYIVKKSLHVKNLPLFLHALLILPLTNLSVLSGYFSSLMIPDFILYYIHSKKLLFHILSIVFILLMLISIRFCVILHCYCLTKGDYRRSLRSAFWLTRGQYLSTIACLLLWNLIMMIVLLVSLLLCFLVCSLILRLFLPNDFQSNTLYFSFSIILTVLCDAYIFFSIPFSFAVFSSIYYRQLKKKKLPIPSYTPEGGSLLLWVTKRIFLVILLIACVFHIFYFRLVSASDFFWNQNVFDRPSITAHRGDSKVMPENTIAAFQSAIESGADVIELDVQYTLDKEIVVFHDATLRRLCSVNTEIGLLRYDSLLAYDIAQKKDSLDTTSIDPRFWENWEEYGINEISAYHTIPTLEQALAFCKGRIDLNIEIKESPYNKDIEKEIVSLLEEYDYVEHCVIAATDTSYLKKIKARNKDIQTVYLLSVAYGSYAGLDYIDGVSIKSSFLTRKLVHDIHDNGKSVYAWTVNQSSEMERMYSLGIDSLITDYPSQAKDTYYAKTLNPTLYTWLKQLANAWR